MSGYQSMVRPFRHRNYQLFFSGQGISLIGTWMQSVAQAWLVYRLTDSAALLGLVGFCGQIPIFLVSPLAGIVADRFERKTVILCTQGASMLLAFLLAWLTLTDRVMIWHVFVLAGLLGIANAFDVPARQAFVIELVGKEDLINAIALNSSMYHGARVVGPAMAGGLVALIGEGWCFLLNAVSYVAVIIGLLLIRVPPRPQEQTSGTALGRILAGFTFVFRNTPFWYLILLLGVISLFGAPYLVLMPIVADRILHSGAHGLGLLMGCSGLGALFGALTLAMRDEAKGLGRWIHLSAVGFGLSIILFALSDTFWMAALFLIPAGYCMIMVSAASNMLLQFMSPDEMRGRVMATFSMMILGMVPFSALLSGSLAELAGARLTIALGGVACLLAAILFGLYLPALRTAAQPFMDAQRTTALPPRQAANQS